MPMQVDGVLAQAEGFVDRADGELPVEDLGGHDVAEGGPEPVLAPDEVGALQARRGCNRLRPRS